MDLKSIRDFLRAEPFKPFAMCLADGRRVGVKHPEFVAMGPRVVLVTDEDNSVTIIEPLLIVSLEQTPPTGGSGNGTGRKKRKS